MGSMVAARRTYSSYPEFLAGTNPSDLVVQPFTTPAYSPGLVRQLGGLPHVRGVAVAVPFNAITLTSRRKLGTVLLAQVQLAATIASVLRALGAGPATIMADGLPGMVAAVAAGALLAGALAVGLSPFSLFGPVREVEPGRGDLPRLDGARAWVCWASSSAWRGGGRVRLPAGAAPGSRPRADR